jgi:hypothetical protein
MLSRIAHVIEGEIHNGGVINVDPHGQPMRLISVGGGADFGGSTDFGRGTDVRRIADLRRTGDLRAHHQGERNGSHSSEAGE